MELARYVYGEEKFVIILEDRRIMMPTVESDVLVLAVSIVLCVLRTLNYELHLAQANT